ncbi:nuclear receptor 2C2-associated protein isoform X3 [Prinia subflava]|uniref:nuclear receptor 2C2-associated protein isoform X2 n=1 Tax=Prinia subflava TaxID=208062 RepID=UPI002FDF9AB1
MCWVSPVRSKGPHSRPGVPSSAQSVPNAAGVSPALFWVSPMLSRCPQYVLGVLSVVQVSPLPPRCPHSRSGVPTPPRCPHLAQVSPSRPGVPILPRCPHPAQVSPFPPRCPQYVFWCPHPAQVSPSCPPCPALSAGSDARGAPGVRPHGHAGELRAEPGREALWEAAPVRWQRGDLLELGPGCRTGEELVKISELYPQDSHAMQRFQLEETVLDKLKITFGSSTDFFGRIVVYHLGVLGERL